MDLIRIDERNIDQEHICCAIGNDKENRLRAETKKIWMKSQYRNGLVFVRLNARGKIFIEYMPIEYAWKPIAGKNYYVINCLWVSGQYKGQGISTELLNECINDAKANKKDGIVVVTSAKARPFLTDKKYYQKHGFETIDTAEPYFELLELKLKKDAKSPQFTKKAKLNRSEIVDGFSFIYANQCPFMEEYVGLLSKVCESKKKKSEIIKLTSYKEAQAKGSPFGTLGIYYNGDFITHELMTEKKFGDMIEKITG